MKLGPVELLIIKFPKSDLSADVAPALRELVEGRVIRIIDIVFLKKGHDGKVTMTEINDLDDDYARFDPIVADRSGLLTEDDVQSSRWRWTTIHPPRPSCMRTPGQRASATRLSTRAARS